MDLIMSSELSKPVISNSSIQLKISMNVSSVDQSEVDDADLWYFIAEAIIGLIASFGNIIVLIAYLRIESLRTVTNTYIFSLAFTDFLISVIGIPLTIWSVRTKKPSQFHLCIVVHILIMTLCTVSLFHLLVMAVDKYLTITFATERWKHRRFARAYMLITGAWVLGVFVGMLPLFGWHADRSNFNGQCEFLNVLSLNYLVHVIFFGTIVLPTIVILYCYLCIYRKILRQTEVMAHVLRACELMRRQKQKKTVIKSLVLVVIAFVICWYPLYSINTLLYYAKGQLEISPSWILFAVLLSHISCALNPVIYAYGLPGFRQAIISVVLCVKRPDRVECVTQTNANHQTNGQSNFRDSAVSFRSANFRLGNGNASNNSLVTGRCRTRFSTTDVPLAVLEHEQKNSLKRKISEGAYLRAPLTTQTSRIPPKIEEDTRMVRFDLDDKEVSVSQSYSSEAYL